MSAPTSPVEARSGTTAEVWSSTSTVGDWFRLIRSEYLEMPDLRLTRAQVERLWGLDTLGCEALLEALVETEFLKRTGEGAYVRADAGP